MIPLIPENEEKREYLEGYIRAVKASKEIEMEIEQLRLAQMYPTLNQDGMPHAHNHTDLSDYAAAISGLLEKYEKKRLQKIHKKHEISEAIDVLQNDTERLILRYRYLCLVQTQEEKKKHEEGSRQLTWNEIALKSGYSFDRVTHIHGEALAHLQLDNK